MKIWTKSENFKIQDGGRLWRHLFDYCCRGNQLDTAWFRLIESTNETCYTYQVSCQSDELYQKRKGGGGSNWPPLPPRLRVTIFSSRLLRLSMICSKTKSNGVKNVYCQILSCFGRHVGLLKRDTNMAAPYISFQNNLIFTDPYLCCERHSCSKMLLNCVVFPTTQS